MGTVSHTHSPTQFISATTQHRDRHVRSNADVVDWVMHCRHQGPIGPGVPWSHVYIMEHGGLYKIGLSKNPHKRVKGITRFADGPIHLVYSRWVHMPYLLEAGLHIEFRDEWMHGEWFNLSPQQVSEAMRRIDFWQLAYAVFGEVR